MKESGAGGGKKGESWLCAGSENECVSRELEHLVQLTEQEKASACVDVSTMGSNARLLDEYLQKLQKDLDDCLKDEYEL
jgi:hypothetical protein